MKTNKKINYNILGISLSIIFISIGHYLLSPHHGFLHNVLQRLYYIPIIWAAYKYGKNSGLIISIICGIVYLPHILITWGMHPEYQTNQIIEIILFIIIGFSSGLLFEQKVINQRLLQSYEKMALFGNLSRSIIRSLKIPLKAISGMLIALEPFEKQNPAMASCLDVIKIETKSIESVRNDLISLVERKKLRLKKQNINEILFSFLSEAEIGLRHKNILITKEISNVKFQGYVNKKALIESLHLLLGKLVENYKSIDRISIYSKETSAYILIGGFKSEPTLDKYYYSKLSDLNSDNYQNYEMISIINVMNNHFGDCRFRWKENDLDEFILVFPKKLKLPWYLKDEPVQDKTTHRIKTIKSFQRENNNKLTNDIFL